MIRIEIDIGCVILHAFKACAPRNDGSIDDERRVGAITRDLKRLRRTRDFQTFKASIMIAQNRLVNNPTRKTFRDWNAERAAVRRFGSNSSFDRLAIGYKTGRSD